MKKEEEIIDSLSYSSGAWMPIKVNTQMYAG
jgi:hypothetical protein